MISGSPLSPRGAVLDALSPVEIASQAQIHKYLTFVAISFLYYDHILTLATEISYVWRRARTASSYWFFVHRYLSFGANIVVVVVGFQNLPSNGCKRYHLFRQILLILQQVIIGILLTLRIYAIYGRNKKILASMVTSFAVLLGIAGFCLVGQKSEPVPGYGCHIASSRKTATRLSVAWIVLFVYDTLLFSLTLAKTYQAGIRRGMTKSSVTLSTLILRDGAIYFVVMALANLSNTLSFYLAGPLMRGGLSTFASCISVTSMSRLMLNLHQSATTGILSTLHTSKDAFLTTGFDIPSPQDDEEFYDYDRPLSGPVDYQMENRTSVCDLVHPSSSSTVTAVEAHARLGRPIRAISE